MRLVMIESKRKLEITGLVILGLISAVLRFYKLSYSHFQGDEIRALFTSGSLVDFLLQQKKGPVQFVVTYLMSFVRMPYDEFVTRIPFALAGFAAVFLFYLVIKELYGRRIAFIATFLFSVNGFFVAFSRIVQYQSFTYLFSILAFYCFVKLFKTHQTKFLVVGSVAMAISFLSHYDAVFIGLPSLYFFVKWFIDCRDKNKYLKVFYSGLLFVFIVATFYLPFISGPSFSSLTKGYLDERISGGAEKATSTIVTFRLYNPLFSFYFLSAFFGLGILFGRLKLIPIYLWFLLPFIIFNFFVSVPGTHIYNYVIPLIIVAAYGVSGIFDLLRSKSAAILYSSFILVIFSFFLFQSYKVYLESYTQYPWMPENILFWKIEMPPERFHLSVFGFPYNRKLKEVAEYLRFRGDVGKFSSNEKSKLFRYYVTLETSSKPAYDAYIYVYGAQSLVTKRSSRVRELVPDKIFYVDGNPVAEIYLIKL